MSHSYVRQLAGMAIGAALCACTAPSAQHPAADFQYSDLPQDAYAVVAQIRAKPGMEDRLREVTLPLVNAVRGEPNNILYFLQEDRNAPGHFIFYEIFKTQADFEAHNATPHVQAWFAHLPELAEGDVTVTHMHIRGNSASAP